MPYLSRHAHEAIRSAAQKWSFPGGYPVYAIMADGESLCPDCLISNLRLIVLATHDYEQNPPGFDDQWAVQAAEINWEDPHNYCCNCGARIPSAYGEPEDGAQERVRQIAMPLPEDDEDVTI